MLAFNPLFVTATAILAAYTSAAPLSHSTANPTKGVTPTLFRFTDPTTYRIPTAVAKDRASNPEKRDIDPTTTTTNRILTVVAKDRAPSPGEKDDIDHSPPDVSPAASANIQYHTAVKREVRGPFLHAPLILSSFDIPTEKWYEKKQKKHNGQAKPDNPLNRQAMEGEKGIDRGDEKGQSVS